MNKAEVLAMKPGRELDNAVKLHIFNNEHDPNLSPSEFIAPSFSTNIVAAWKVWEKILDPNRSSICPLGNGSTGLYYAIMYDDDIVATGKTISEAICKASLITPIEEDKQC